MASVPVAIDSTLERSAGPRSVVARNPVRRDRCRSFIEPIASVLPAGVGAVALVVLLFIGHVGVRDSVRRANLLADAVAEISLASATGAPLHLEAARALTLEAGEFELALLAAGTVPAGDSAALEQVLRIYSERRVAIQHQAETRFLYLSGAGLALLTAGTVASVLLWRRRWALRWRHIRCLSAVAQALAERPLEAAVVPCQANDDLGRLETVLSSVAGQLADYLVHQQRLTLLGEHVAFVTFAAPSPASPWASRSLTQLASSPSCATSS